MEKVLYDSLSWLDQKPADYIDEFLDCTDHTRDEYKNEEDLLEAVSYWLECQSLYEWDDFLELLRNENDTHCLVTGYFMSWMGPQEGGKVFKNLWTAVTDIPLSDSHLIFSINEEGLLTLEETHHDAPCKGNHYEFRLLTAAGEKYYEKHANDDRRSLCEALLTNKRTRNLKLSTLGLTVKDFADITK